MPGDFGFDLPLDSLGDLGGLGGGASSGLSGLSGAGGFGLGDLSMPGGALSGGETTGAGWDKVFAGQVPGTSPSPNSGGGSSGWFNSIFGNAQGQSPSPLSAFAQTLGLGATGLGLANTIGAMNQQGGQQRVQQQGQQLATSAAQPAINYGTQLVTDAGQGKLSPASEAKIAQWVQQAKADMQAKLAHLGLGDSTSLQQYSAQIDQMALAMRESALQQEGSLGVTALGTGAQTGLGLAQSGGQNTQLLNDLISQANRTLGFLGGRQN